MAEQPNWRRYLRFWGPDIQHDIEDELEFHIAMRKWDLVARGRTVEEAERETEQAFGDLHAIEKELIAMNVKHQNRQRRIDLLGDAWADLRQAMRVVLKRPVPPTAIVLTLALAIGAATTVFTLFDAVLLNPVPVRAPKELVTLQENTGVGISYPMLQLLRNQTTKLAGLTAHGEQSVSVREGDRAERLTASVVGGDYFNVLGLIPLRGRLLLPEDEEKAAHHAVISEQLWARWFGAENRVTNQTVEVNGRSFTIVGVAPGQFRGTELANPVDVWIPVTTIKSIGNGGLFSHDVLESWSFKWLDPIGRLNVGATAVSALAELRTLHQAAIAAAGNNSSDAVAVQDEAVTELVMHSLIEGAAARNREDLVRFMAVLAAVVGTCLAIACLNVSNLLAMRFTERRRELSVRMALGAEPQRILRQFLIEHLFLALAAGAAGVLLAAFSVRLLTVFDLPGGISLGQLQLDLNTRVLGFTFGVSLLCALGFGLGPAVLGTRVSPLNVLHARLRNRRSRWAGGPALVFVQVALSLVLLVTAALFLRSLQNALRVELGYASSGIASASVGLRQNGYTAESAPTFIREALRLAQAQPGVDHAAIATRVPIDPNTFSLSISRTDTKQKLPRMAINSVTPEYFEVLSIPLLRGRNLSWADTRDSEKSGLITEDAAKRFWPGEDPLGKQLQIFPPFGPTVTIVGVVGAGHFASLSETTPYLFLSILQETGLGAMDEMTLIGRGANSDAVLAGVRNSLRELDPRLPVFHERNVEDRIAAVLMPQRLGSLLLVGFGAIALLICCVGIYAVTAYDVARRRRELGIRMALGARRRNLVDAVLGRNGIAISCGAAVGLVLAALCTSGLRRLLFGIEPYEAVSYLSAAVFFGIVALLACWVPTRRALRTDPLRVIRETD